MSTFNRSEKQKSNRILNQMDGEKRRRVRDLASLTASSRDNPLATYLLTTPGAGTWSKPDFGTKVEVWACGGGPGGGSGRKGAAASIRGGGTQGTSSVPRLLGIFNASDFPSSISFDIGAGGAGGAAQTTNSTNGNNGVAGGNTTVTINGYTYTLVGGAVGGGGTAVQRSSTVPAVFNVEFSSVFRYLNTTGPGGDALADNSLIAPTIIPSPPSDPLPGANATFDASIPGPFPVTSLLTPARGGAASITGNAQKGGDGVLGIGGAGGGGATDSVGDSGAGGRGGDGFVYIIVY